MFYSDQSTILSPLDATIASAKLDFQVTVKCPGCFMKMILDIDDPTSCRVDISLLGSKYSIIWNLLPYCY
jgi:hypothetical protein